MLDERWPSEVAELSAGLRTLLEKTCGTDVVRAAEARPDGRDEALEERLAAFGLAEIPASAAMLAAAAWEVGRALAPVPYVETAIVSAVVGVVGVTYGFEGAVPVPPARTAVHGTNGPVVVVDVGPARRTAAGDRLAEPPILPSAGDPAGGPQEALRMRRLARLLHAARIGGAAERLLETAVEHVTRRTQFGKPVGAFQAVAHKLADAAVALDGLALLVRKSAWVSESLQGGDGAPSQVFATMVWAKAVDAGRHIAAAVHQVMGGYGFALEEDTQLFTRRIRSWTMRLPAPGRELAGLARSLIDPAQRDSVRHLWQHDEGIPLPRWAEETDRGSAR